MVQPWTKSHENIEKAGLPKFGHTYLYDGETGTASIRKQQ